MSEPRRAESPRQDGHDRTHEARRAQRAFLAHMRHELRTPMNAILGYSEILLEDAAERGLEAFIPDLQKIHTAGNQLLTLVNDMLTPEKLEAGTSDVDLATFGSDLRHELRTPINAVVGYSAMLLEDAADRGQRDLIPDLQKIHAAANRFLSLINDIVDFTQY
jgi:signal transduction histidine kinase